MEQLLLRSIEWTAFLEATYDIALEQANVILRYFLGSAARLTVSDLQLTYLYFSLTRIRKDSSSEIVTRHAARRARVDK
jgi:nuclear pore complex protein Nup107